MTRYTTSYILYPVGVHMSTSTSALVNICCVGRVAVASSALLVRLFLVNDPATSEIYTLSLHDALPISHEAEVRRWIAARGRVGRTYEVDDIIQEAYARIDRKSTRLNSSHVSISYAVFCLKKKKARYARQ